MGNPTGAVNPYRKRTIEMSIAEAQDMLGGLHDIEFADKKKGFNADEVNKANAFLKEKGILRENQVGTKIFIESFASQVKTEHYAANYRLYLRCGGKAKCRDSEIRKTIVSIKLFEKGGEVYLGEMTDVLYYEPKTEKIKTKKEDNDVRNKK